ncbi:hypothetical protein D9M69_706970 [compost metagenome]
MGLFGGRKNIRDMSLHVAGSMARSAPVLLEACRENPVIANPLAGFGSESRADADDEESAAVDDAQAAQSLAVKTRSVSWGKHRGGQPRPCRSCAQSKPGPGSCLRPGAMCSWPATWATG